MKEQAETKNAGGHFFKGRPKRLALILAIIIIISLVVLAIFLYLHQQKDSKTQNSISDSNTPGTITAIDNTLPTNQDTGKIDTTPSAKSATDYFDEGQALMSTQSWEKAAESFSQAISIDAKVPNYFNRKSQAQYNLGQKDQAINTLEAGLAANPDSDLLRSRLDVLQKDYIGSQPQ